MTHSQDIDRFQSSFGGLVEPDSIYHDPEGFQTGGEVGMKGWRYGKDMKSSLQEKMLGTWTQTIADRKAMGTTIGGAGTAGYAMIPIYVDPRIVDVTRKYTPLVELTPRTANMGMTSDFNKLTAKGGAAFGAEDGPQPDVVDTYARVSTAIKFLYSVGRVTGPAQAAFPSYTLGGFTESAAPTAKQLDIIVKTRALRELEENAIVNGDASALPLWFNGMITTQSTTNKVDKNTTALSLDDLYTAVQYAFDDGGRPNLAVCSSSVYNDIQNLMFDQMRAAMPMTELAWGYSAVSLMTMVGKIPLLPSMYMSNVSGSKAIYFEDMSEIGMKVLQDVTYEDLAKTNDSNKYMLKCYETYENRSTGFCSFVGEIK